MTNPPASESALAQTARFLDWSGRLAAVGVFEWLPETEHLAISDTACALLELPPARVPTLGTLLNCFDADGRAMLSAALQTATVSGAGWDAELGLQRSPDTPAHGARVLRVMGGCDLRSPLRVMVALQDISERIRVRTVLEEALASLELATHSGRIGVWHHDLSTRQLAWDETMWRLHGAATEGNHTNWAHWRERLHHGDAPALDAAWTAALAGLEPLDVAFRILTPEGELRHLRCVARVLRDRYGEPLRLTGVCWDETPLRLEADALHHRATHDPLTGLVNRTEFSERLQRLQDRPGPHAVLALDLDHFKAVNDTHGHAAGDAVLCQVANVLQRCLRQRDTLARLGGDEFAALLAHCSLAEAEQVTQKIRDTLLGEGFHHAGTVLRVGASIGIASMEPGMGEAELMASADAACLRAKGASRRRPV